MTKDFAFMFLPGDYLRDTQCLSEKTQVAYDRIMCEHMRNICVSQQQLKFFTKRLSDEEMAELKLVLTKVDGGFQISWVAESIMKRMAYSESRSRNRTKSYDIHMEDEDKNKDKDEKVNEKEIEIDNVIQEFNKIVGSNYQTKSKAIREYIRARLTEGYSKDDCIKVIQIKSRDWKGTDMEKYLRPSTLFRPTKFPEYLNQKEQTKSTPQSRHEEFIKRQNESHVNKP